MLANQTTTERVPYMLGRSIEAVKAEVRIEDVVAHYTAAKLLGNGRLLARCVALDHEDKTPSMVIYTDSQRFRCYGCGLRGDAIDLEEIGGRHVETWTAVVALAERYGVELPRRPERWHQWTNEKDRRHKMLLDVLTRSYQRRYFRVFSGVILEGIEDPEDRRAEAERIWRDIYAVARRSAISRMTPDA